MMKIQLQFRNLVKLFRFYFKVDVRHLNAKVYITFHAVIIENQTTKSKLEHA